MQANLHRKVEHGALAWRDIGLAVVHRHLVGDQRFLFINPQNRAVRHHAIQAAVGRAGGGDNHFALAFGQRTVGVAAFFLDHQRIVVRKKSAPFSRTAGQRQKHVGHEAGLFLHFQNFGLKVVGQGVDVGHGITNGHGLSLSGVGIGMALEGP